MNSKKQKLLLEYLLSSSDTFALCHGILQSDYFDPEFRNTVEFIFDYYEQFSSTPTPKQVEAETNLSLELYDILGNDEIGYCSAEVEKFCKRRALEIATLSLPGLIEKGDYGEAEKVIKDAVTISLHRDLGLSYFENVKERLDRVNVSAVVHPTGWTELDDKLFGGISRKELTLVSANSGGGKSITLANMGLKFAEDGLHTLYISLELSEDRIASRSDTMITGINRDWRDHIEEIATLVTAAGKGCGRYDVKQMAAGSSSNDIRSLLKEYHLQHGFYPDMLIVDYLDEMSPNEKVSADNVWEKDKRCSSQLRQILVDYNMYGATASQLNRNAVNAAATEHDHSQIAGGISKINVADVYWSIVMTDAMREVGEITFIIQKTRNSDGVGSIINLKWDAIHLKILNPNELSFVKKGKTKPQTDKPENDMQTLLEM